MVNDKNYVVSSLELHLFFARIMKEHAVFYMAGFTPKNTDYARQANYFKENFEQILQKAVALAPGVVSPGFVSAWEAVSDYTLGSELKTINLTGISINTSITRQEANLWGSDEPKITSELTARVKELAQRALPFLDGFIKFGSNVLNSVLSCNMFTANYPLNLEHMVEEAEEYRENLTAIEAGHTPNADPAAVQKFWDNIMEEHAMFIRGLLDPTEQQTMMTADNTSRFLQS